MACSCSCNNKEELGNALQNNPFTNDSSKDTSFMHLTFLSSQPDKELVEKISAGNYLPDEFIIYRNLIYLYCPMVMARPNSPIPFLKRNSTLLPQPGI